MGDLHSFLLAAVVAAVTALLRFAPFLAFRDGKRPLPSPLDWGPCSPARSWECS